jgi:hypothetical protein
LDLQRKKRCTHACEGFPQSSWAHERHRSAVVTRTRNLRNSSAGLRIGKTLHCAWPHALTRQSGWFHWRKLTTKSAKINTPTSSHLHQRPRSSIARTLDNSMLRRPQRFNPNTVSSGSLATLETQSATLDMQLKGSITRSFLSQSQNSSFVVRADSPATDRPDDTPRCRG